MRIIAAIAAAMASLVASTAMAQTMCGPRQSLGQMLAERYGEVPVAAGLASGLIVELLVSPEGSWTLIQTLPDRSLSCVIAGGDNWVERPAPPAISEPKGKGA